MQQDFRILPSDIHTPATNLFGEISSSGLSFFFQDEKEKRITGLSVFSFGSKTENAAADVLKEALDAEELLKEKFNNVFISYACNESLLIPGSHYVPEQNSEDLNLLYGDLHLGTILTDHIAERNLYNLYRVPNDIHRQVISRFHQPVFFHQRSLLVKQLPDEADLLRLIFYPNRVLIVLQKQGKLQIIQAFGYITAEDVLYHMLNVCRRFDATEVKVQLCGMVQEDSGVYNEIRKYFLRVSFLRLPAELSYSDELKQLPGHFFSQLFSFALCV